MAEHTWRAVLQRLYRVSDTERCLRSRPASVRAADTPHRFVTAQRNGRVATDLPAGAKWLKQKANGIAATIINGEMVLENQEDTGARPGQLLRGPHAAGSG